MLAFALLAIVMFACVVLLGTEPQIPMAIGCAIVILAMAYVGILQNTGLMHSLIEPITSRLNSFGSLSAGTVASGAVFNVPLPDIAVVALVAIVLGGKLGWNPKSKWAEAERS